MDFLNDNITLNLVVDILLFLFLSIIFISCAYDSRLRKQYSNRHYILWIGFYLIYFLIDILNILAFSEFFNSSEYFKKYCLGLLYFTKILCTIPAYLWVANMIKEKSSFKNKLKTPILIFIIMVACAFFAYIILYKDDVDFVDSDIMSDLISKYYRGFLLFYQVSLSILVISKNKYLGSAETIFILLTINVVPLVDYVPFWEKRLSNIAITIFLLIIYARIWNQRRIELAESENQLTNARVRLMVS